VAVASRNVKQLQTFAMELNRGDHRIVPFRCDVTDPDEVEVLVGNVVEVWDRIDILVNNSGASGMTPVAGGAAAGAPDDADRRWQEILATNLTGIWNCVRQAVRHMPDGGAGRIISIASVLGKFGVPGYGAYCASKHGVIGLTRALALELAPRAITVNAVCPGWVATDMSRQGIEEGARRQGIPPDEFRRRAEEMVPLRRFIEPGEVAGLVAFLASEAGAGITGQAINLDGGAAMW
jgi:ketoreductase